MYTIPRSVLIVSPAASGKVHRIGDLEGRRVGVSAFGSPTHFLNYVLVVNGMQPTDVNAIGIGDEKVAPLYCRMPPSRRCPIGWRCG
jgi:ABC-type nitrate/sulfonate/bicarbonate transport system substrate-binding protein